MKYHGRSFRDKFGRGKIARENGGYMLAWILITISFFSTTALPFFHDGEIQKGPADDRQWFEACQYELIAIRDVIEVLKDETDITNPICGNAPNICYCAAKTMFGEDAMCADVDAVVSRWCAGPRGADWEFNGNVMIRSDESYVIAGVPRGGNTRCLIIVTESEARPVTFEECEANASK